MAEEKPAEVPSGATATGGDVSVLGLVSGFPPAEGDIIWRNYGTHQKGSSIPTQWGNPEIHVYTTCARISLCIYYIDRACT